MIHANVKRWGNSPAIRIPAALMQALNLNIDDEIKLNLIEGKIIIEPIKKETPIYSLEELVQKITPENLNDSVDWGEPAGREIW